MYSRNGLSVQERTDLQARIRDIRADIRLADGGRFDRDTRYGSWGYDGPRYDRNGRRDDNGLYDVNGNRIDVNTGVYGTNVYNGPRYDRYGRRDDNGMYDVNGNRIDVNTGVYGSNVYNGPRYDRYGRRDDNGMYDANGNRIDNGYYGQGGPYEEADNYDCVDRGGIGGVIDDVIGRGCTTLRVGSRVSSNLGAVPYQYRSQFRDGNGYYYRSDGRSIYQIDVRTNTVVRVYSMNR
jgi:hypothetical protein